jgi:GxxExxY protein
MPYDDEPTPYENLPEPSEKLNELSRLVIGAAIEVHRQLGPGLPEEAYQRAMEIEFGIRQIPFERQKVVEIVYKGVLVAKGKIDLLVGGLLVVEIKSVESIGPVHRLQIASYMRIINQSLGLLLNFNVAVMKDGIRRVIQSF